MARRRTKYTTHSDMGSIKIYNDHMSCFYLNDIGDVPNTVYIYNNPDKQIHDHKFLGHFTVKTTAYLSTYDCNDSVAYIFAKGRHFVYLEQGTSIFHIEKVDELLNC